MKLFLFFFAFFLFLSTSEALEGKALYDYMCLFINIYINDAQYEKTIESIYVSEDWKTLDAQYGPFIRPTPTPQK
jgi:hypothetical protein